MPQSTAMSPLRRHRTGRPHRSLPVAAALVGVALVAGCGATDIPTPRRTVTVTVDAPAPAGTSEPAPASTSAPTSSPTTAAVPTALAVGRQRGAPKSFAEAKGRIDAARPAANVGARFASPTGNIVCVRGTGDVAVACEVEEGRIAPPLPTICSDGAAPDIGRIELRRDGAVPVCNSDTIREGREPRLAYGARTAPSGTTACISEQFGVTCIDESSQHGFFLARDTFVTF